MIERVKGAKDLTAEIGYNDVEVAASGFDTKHPWSEIKVVDDNGNDWTTASTGNKWIRIPRFYVGYEFREDGTIKGRSVSQYKIDENWHLNPIFLRGTTELPYIDIGAYFMSKSGLSITGSQPYQSMTPADMRTKLPTSELYEYNLYNIWAHMIIQTLFTIEFATTDVSTTMPGYRYSSYSKKIAVNGTLDNADFETGVNANKENNLDIATIKYRNIENPWNNGQCFIDDILFSGEVIKVRSVSSEEYINSTISRSNSDGIVSAFSYDSNTHLIFPTKFNNESGPYYGAYDGSNGNNQVLYCGINRNNNDGIFCYMTSVNSTGSLSNSVFRAIRRPL